MRNFQKLVAVIALSGLCFAAPVPSDSDAPKKSTKKHAATVVKKDPTAEQLKELKQQIEQQQAATQQLQEQLKQTQQQLQSTQQQLSQTQATANAANAKASTVETNTTVQVQKVQSDLTDVKAALSTTEATVANDDKLVKELENPNTIAYKGVRLTPGGFADFTGYFRAHATNSGPATAFNALPLGTALTGVGGLSEYNQSARASQLRLRVDSEAGATKLAAYFEGDFYGVSVANPNQTTAWPFRIRQAWGRATFANGWKITGGQMWNLMAMNRRAADADAPWIPNTLDTNYIAGWDWGRQAELRISKELIKNVAFTVGLVDPSGLSQLNNTSDPAVAGVVTVGSGNLGNGYVTGCTGTSSTTTGGVALLCPVTQLYSTNLAPDVIAKLTYDDPKFGHYEIKGVARFFRDRVNETTHNNYATGAGIGAGVIIPVIAKKVDFVAQGLYGKGISRYQDSGQYDFEVRTNAYENANGANAAITTGADQGMQTLKAFSAIVGFETHPTTRLEFDAFYGTEYYYRDTYTVTGTATSNLGLPVHLGYGASNAANNKNIGDGTLVLWYDVAKGRFGTLRYGAQYEYAYRDLWTSYGSAAPHVGAYKGVDNDIYLGMRYILP
jgi:hypothetical protein